MAMFRGKKREGPEYISFPGTNYTVSKNETQEQAEIRIERDGFYLTAEMMLHWFANCRLVAHVMVATPKDLNIQTVAGNRMKLLRTQEGFAQLHMYFGSGKEPQKREMSTEQYDECKEYFIETSEK